MGMQSSPHWQHSQLLPQRQDFPQFLLLWHTLQTGQKINSFWLAEGFYFILFPDVGNKAIVNVPDFNGGNKLFSKCNISLYLYSLEKCNAKFPKNLLNVISAVTESPVNARA